MGRPGQAGRSLGAIAVSVVKSTSAPLLERADKRRCADGERQGKVGQGVARWCEGAAAPVKRRVRLDTDERRAQLLELSRRAFNERPYDRVSMEEITAAAGISKGLLYHYFPTKRDLYVAGLRETSRQLITLVTAALEHCQTPIERVRAGLDVYLEFVSAASGGLLALMRGGIGSDAEVATVVEETRRAFLDQFMMNSPIAHMFVREPLFRLTARGWLGMVEAMSIEWVSKPEVSRETLRELLVVSLISGVGNARDVNLRQRR
jgi:AcrR family transcriptional regulator